MSELKEEIGEFLLEIYPLLHRESHADTASSSKISEHQHMVEQVLTEVIDWAAELVEGGYLYEVSVHLSLPHNTLSFQVLRTVRTGVTYQGRKAVAICLDDLPQVSTSSRDSQRAVKEGNLGKHNVAKDFVPPNSTDIVIRRGCNSKSRKCTVIWLDQLPSEIVKGLLQGNTEGYQ